MDNPLTGKHVVIGCTCDPTYPLALLIESNAVELTEYLKLYWQSVHSKASRAAEVAAKSLASLGWSEMAVAPKTGATIEVKLQDGTIITAHWAQDLTGEEQPPFQGWFDEYRNQVFPVHWRPISGGN